MIWVLAFVIEGIITGTIAYKKGRSFWGWFLFGGLLFIVALPASIIVSDESAVLEYRELDNRNKKKCPACAELVKVDAKICRYCGSNFY